MMKILTLVRHAKSSWGHPGLADRERPLNRRGERDAPEMGRRIAATEIRPSLICASPAVRTWSTARLIAAEIGYPTEFLQKENDLYLASVGDFLDVLARQDSAFNSILLVGHNPGISEFANFLSPGVAAHLPTAGVVAVSFESADWQLLERPATKLLLHDFPKNDRRPNDD